MNITFNIIYCTENQTVVNNFIRDLRGENAQFHLVPANNESLVRRALSDSAKNILFLTDNFLKNEDCLLNAYRDYHFALKQNQLTCIVADGYVLEKDGRIIATPTKIEHVSQMMHYLNFWQEKYLLAKKQFASAEITEADYSKIKGISADLGAFLQQLRDSGFYYFENLSARNFEQFCQIMGIPQPPAEGRAPEANESTRQDFVASQIFQVETGTAVDCSREHQQSDIQEGNAEKKQEVIHNTTAQKEKELIFEVPQQRAQRQKASNEIDEDDFFDRQSGRKTEGSNIDEIVDEVLLEEEEEDRVQNSGYAEQGDEKRIQFDDDIADFFSRRNKEEEAGKTSKSNGYQPANSGKSADDNQKQETHSLRRQNGMTQKRPQLIDFRLKTSPFVSQFESKNTIAFMDENLNIKNDLERVYGLAKSGNLVAAAAQLEELLAANPESADVHFLAGEIAELQRNFSKSRTHFEKVASLAPFYPKVYHKLSWLCMNHFSAEKKNIKSYFKKALAFDDNNPQLLYAYAEFLNDSGDSAKAIKYFKKVLKVNPEHPFANYDLAITYHRAGEYSLANRYYLEACENNEELSTPENDAAFTSYSILDVERAGEAINLHSLDEDEKMQPFQSAVDSDPASDLTSENELADRLSPEMERAAPMQKRSTALNKFKPQNGAKIVLVTGASAGIGRATAEIFARNGYNLILAARREERLVEMQNYFHSTYSGGCIVLDFDVRDYNSIEMTFRNLDKDWRAVDILINNAGLAIGMDPIHEGNPAHWDTMIDTNIKGLLYMTRVIAPGMVEKRSGHIINLCSTAGKEAYPNGNVYSATKFAVESLTKNMRIDLHKYGIRVGQVSPGAVEETEFSQVRFLGDQEKAAKIYEGFIPLKASDVADIVYFMATSPAHVNIQDVLVMGTQQASATIIDRSGR